MFLLLLFFEKIIVIQASISDSVDKLKIEYI